MCPITDICEAAVWCPASGFQEATWFSLNVLLTKPIRKDVARQELLNGCVVDPQAWEPLFYQYGVDLVLAGHVHSYERTNRVYNYANNPCGPVYITTGRALDSMHPAEQREQSVVHYTLPVVPVNSLQHTC